jgi:hypothetical protein
MTSCLISSKNAELPADRPEKEFIEDPLKRGVGGCNSMSLPKGESLVDFSVGSDFLVAACLVLK